MEAIETHLLTRWFPGRQEAYAARPEGHARAPAPIEVSWLDCSGVHRSPLDNIGLGGCYVRTVERVRVGDHVYVDLQAPEGGGLILEGEVAHQQWPLGFGLRFLGLGERERLAVTRLMGCRAD